MGGGRHVGLGLHQGWGGPVLVDVDRDDGLQVALRKAGGSTGPPDLYLYSFNMDDEEMQ